MRLFTAIELCENAKRAVSSVADNLSLFGKGSFVKSGSNHVTLAFLGEMPSAAEAIRAMEALSFPPFTLTLRDLGHFGSTYFVSTEESKELKLLQKSLCDNLRAEGLTLEELKFTPHITLARRFTPTTDPMIFVPDTSWTVERVVLMQTVGAGEYKILHEKRCNLE